MLFINGRSRLYNGTLGWEKQCVLAEPRVGGAFGPNVLTLAGNC